MRGRCLSLLAPGNFPSLFSPTSNSAFPTSNGNADRHRPGNWHAMQLNNPFAALELEQTGKNGGKNKKDKKK